MDINNNQISTKALLDLIKQKKQVNSKEYSELKDVLYQGLFNKIPVVSMKIPAGDYVFRTVPIYREDLTMGTKKNLSYRPLEYGYSFFNRCSEPEQRHFYCSTDRHLSIVECSYFISQLENNQTNFDRKIERFEVGMWQVCQDLYLADLRFGDISEGETQTFKQDVRSRYRDFAKDEIIIEFFDYINNRFQVPIKKDDHLEYWLTACYSNYIFDEVFTPQKGWGTMKDIDTKSNVALDGIFYHSVKGIKAQPNLKGFNLALRTDIVDTGKIKLVKAGIFETRMVNEKEFDLDVLIKQNINIQGDSWYYDTVIGDGIS